MTEIFRVGLLFVTLLLNDVYWPPSVVGEGDASDFTPGERLVGTLIRPYINHGCDGARTAVAFAEYPLQAALQHFDNLHASTALTGSTASTASTLSSANAFRPQYSSTEIPVFTPGHAHIVKLLLSFYSANCKVGVIDIKDLPDSVFSPGEKQISKLLSSFMSSGCSGAAEVSRNLGTASDPDLTSGEKFLTEFLSAYFLSGCQKPSRTRVESNISGKDDEPREVMANAVGGHLHSVVLEMFLLTIAVFLTRVYL